VEPKKENYPRLGIMGGTFDPIHRGHLKAAEIARKQFHLNKVIFVAAHCPPHKSIEDITPAEHRYAMVDLAIRDIPYFESSRIEMERSCPSYAGDTILALKKLYGDHWHFFFITGLDAILSIINWDRARTYPGICQFIAITRPGYNREEIEKKIPEQFLPHLTIIEDPLLSISSTEIRARVKSSQSIEGMVPKDVQAYISKWRLYQET
jgi:nicotinate-nucleotide adenylyltransferase